MLAKTYQMARSSSPHSVFFLELDLSENPELAKACNFTSPSVLHFPPGEERITKAELAALADKEQPTTARVVHVHDLRSAARAEQILKFVALHTGVLVTFNREAVDPMGSSGGGMWLMGLTCLGMFAFLLKDLWPTLRRHVRNPNAYFIVMIVSNLRASFWYYFPNCSSCASRSRAKLSFFVAGFLRILCDRWHVQLSSPHAAAVWRSWVS